jgi:Undecaprenyl-phosphate glucose phosphotransferase
MDVTSPRSYEPAEPASSPLAVVADAPKASLDPTVVPTDPAISPVVLAALVRGIEFVLIVATGLVAAFIYVIPDGGLPPAYLITIPCITALAVLIFQGLDIYHVGAFRKPALQGLRLLGGWGLAFLVTLAGLFFLKNGMAISRVWLGSWFVGGLSVLLIERSILALVVQRLTKAGRLECRTVIVGGGEPGERLLRELSRQVDTDLSILGFFDDRTDERSGTSAAGFAKLGNVDDLVDYSRSTRIDMVIFALPISAEQRILEIMSKLAVLPVDVRLAAHSNKLRFRPRSYSYIGSIPVLDVMDRPLADWNVILKSAFDLIVGSLALIALSPLLPLVAIAIKLESKGPILFKQPRHGFNGTVFEIWKFRSMYAELADIDAARQTSRDDPRVTRVGRFIRATSIDELPQLFNVLQGRMSIVGPRPHALKTSTEGKQLNEIVDNYAMRHRVKPGLTGWAQIHGLRGALDTTDKIKKRVEHDLYYIENWSIFLDLYILLITPIALLTSRNAY